MADYEGGWPRNKIKESAETLTTSSLARAELSVTLATVFRRFEKQELFQTSRLDVDLKHDYTLPNPDERSKGVRVIFR